MARIQAILIGLCVLSGCAEREKAAPRPQPVMVPAPRDLGFVSNAERIEGTLFFLDADVSRNFMPICPPEGYPAAAFFRIKPNQGSSYPVTIQFEKAWIIQGDQAWTPTIEPQNSPKKGDTEFLIGRAHGGPMWEPGTIVNIVVQIRDENGKLYLLHVEKPVKRLS